jgi:hypothetical protein
MFLHEDYVQEQICRQRLLELDLVIYLGLIR